MLRRKNKNLFTSSTSQSMKTQTITDQQKEDQKRKIAEIEKKKFELLRQAQRDAQQRYQEEREKRNRQRSRHQERGKRPGWDQGKSQKNFSQKGDIQEKPDPKLENKSGTYLLEEEKVEIKQRYLGQQRKNGKLQKPSEKYKNVFVFKWDESEDTSKDVNPIYLAKQDPSLLFGRGHFGGIDKTEQILENERQGGLMLSNRWKEITHQDQYLPKGIISAKRDHWTNKELEEMTERDWRIFREDHNIFHKGGRAPNPIRNWKESELPQYILDALKLMDYKIPSPIQMQAIPLGRACRDMIGLAPTGSGKSAAFLIPLICFIDKLPRVQGDIADDGPYGLILAPSRELASQIHEEFKKLTKFTNLRSAAVIGGKIAEQQAIILAGGVQVVIGTPGRILDCIDRTYLVLNQCQWVILDEADKMIDLGFQEEVNQILDFIPDQNFKSEDIVQASAQEEAIRNGELKCRVTSMFSATMPREVQFLAKKYLRAYTYITIGEPESGKKDIEQQVEFVSQEGKFSKLRSLLKKTEPPVMVFVAHQKATEDIARYVNKLGVSKDQSQYVADSLHGKRTQISREAALRNFKNGKVQVLVCTDLAGRGIDVHGIKHVINFDAPKNIRDYTHRIGRTGRAGNKGLATTMISKQDEDLLYDLKHYLEEMNQHVPQELANHPAAKLKPGGVPDSVARHKQVVLAA